MIHIPLIRDPHRGTLLEFSHFDQDAPAGRWKKENIIVLDTIKINVFVEGSFSVFSDNALHHPIYGDVCLLAPRKMHYGHIASPTHLNYYQLDIGRATFDAIPDGARMIERLLETVALRDAFVRPDPKSRDLVLKLCHGIEDGIRKIEIPLAYAKVIELLCALYHLYVTSAPIPAAACSYHTSQVLQYVEKHYAEPVTVEGIAEESKVSVSYLSRVFKKETGMGIHEYLNQYRILKASALLREYLVTETAYLCGFCDSSHFISVFKKAMGMTPMQYQKSLQPTE